MTDNEYASVNDLLTEDGDGPIDVALPGGRKVRVRGLSRFEWFLAGKESNGGDPNDFETAMVQLGMMAPDMTRAQVDAWRRTPGRSPDLKVVSDEIRRLSGHAEGADKSDP